MQPDDMVDLLRHRGLEIENPQRVSHYIRNIGYYRLSKLISALASFFDFLIYSLNSSLCFLVLRFVPYVFFILRNFSLSDMGQSVVLIVL